MKINIDHVQQPAMLAIFEYLHGYRQSLDKNYVSDWTFSYNAASIEHDINIRFVGMHESISTIDTDAYDLIFVSNNSEPLHVFDRNHIDLLQADNAYILANALLTADHPLTEKVISIPLGILFMCAEYWIRPQYPQLYTNGRDRALPKTLDLIAINGQNRAHRQYFFDELRDCIPGIQIIDNFPSVERLKAGQWESKQDKEFREWVNNRYADSIVHDAISQNRFYEQSIATGIGCKSGKIPLAFFLPIQYYQSHCVIFPESSWQNDEIAITEKAAKCFLAGSVPFPIGGAHTNSLYNSLGFSTAWNLLPDDLKNFDAERDHRARYQSICQAVRWFKDNPSVFLGEQYQQMISTNRDLFTSRASITPCIARLSDIIAACR